MSQATPFFYQQPRPDALSRIDLWLLLACLLLLALGLVMVGSASLAIAEDLHQGAALTLLKKQLFAVGLGLAVAALSFAVPLRVWCKTGPLLLALTLLALTLLALTAWLFPGWITPAKGAARWVRVLGFSFQLSELAKLAFIIFIASHLQRKGAAERPDHLQQLLTPLLSLGLLIALLALQPDYGTAVVIAAVTLGILFVASVRPLQLVGVGAVLAGLMVLLAFEASYRVSRLKCFIDPMAAENASGCGYQLVQALIAIGRGELFGVGLGASVQKLAYLPEAHNDFLLAILAEELGLIGVALVIALYAVVVWRCFTISKMAGDKGLPFAELLSYGIGLLLALQALINIGVNFGMLPTKGLTLPLLSYGGSSMLVFCVALAIVLRIYWELRAPPRRRAAARGSS